MYVYLSKYNITINKKLNCLFQLNNLKKLFYAITEILLKLYKKATIFTIKLL